jgi:hypothetical protein
MSSNSARWWNRVLHRGDAEAAGLPHEVPDDVGHAVYLYGSDEELVDRLESYVTDGWANGQRTILFAKHERAKALRLRLSTWDLQDQIEIHDATWALQQFVRDGQPQKDLFVQLVQDTLARHEPGTVRLYGEMVAVLWQNGEVTAALELEELWNAFLAENHVPLLCAYPEHDLASPIDHGAVCRAHDHVFPQAA